MFHTIDLAQATYTLRYNLGHMFVKTKAGVHDDPQIFCRTGLQYFFAE